MTPTSRSLFERVENNIQEKSGEVVELRRHLHSHPELSLHEYETTKLIAARLTALGLDVHVRPEGIGLYADLTPPNFDPQIHPTIAIRSDMDALPIFELNEVPYASKHTGVMHACGHDVHMATVMGAALGLEVARDDLPGRIRLIYQHAEEVVPGGAVDMVEFGAVNGVDAVLALHCDPELPVGKIGVKPNAFTASFDLFDIKITGKGGHGARPHQCVDPIFVVTQLANALYQSTARNFDARVPVVITIGQIQGGTTSNVIPEFATISGSVRTISQAHRDGLEAMFHRIAGGVSMTHGASYELRFERGAPAIHNDPKITRAFAEVGADLLGPDAIYRIPLPSMGGEDFSYYLERVPGAMFRLGTAGKGPNHFLHSAHFDIDERAIAIGSRILSHTAVRMLNKFAEVKAERALVMA